MKILLVEDEIGLGESVVSFLSKEDYVCEWVTTFPAADEKVALYEYDCVLVDITLPGGSGLGIVKDLKENFPTTGIIIISAKHSIDDKISGLDLGADDYIAKPFHLAELNARIKSVLRRRHFEGSKQLQVGNLTIIPESRQVFASGKPVTLTKKEFALLLFFVANKNRVLTKESLAEHLWGDAADMADSIDFIYSHIKNLRAKLTENGGEDYIESFYGVGYMFSTP